MTTVNLKNGHCSVVVVDRFYLYISNTVGSIKTASFGATFSYSGFETIRKKSAISVQLSFKSVKR